MKENVISIMSSSELRGAQDRIVDMLSERRYPLIDGMPLCVGPIEHNICLFRGSGKGSKAKACEGCKLRKWCDFDHSKHDFEVTPISELDLDLMEFLEERDENSADWI